MKRIIGLILLLIVCRPALAEEEGGNGQVIAAPQASSSGNVTNQAVQVTNTNLFQNTYGGGIQCQGTTLSVSPFAIGGWSAPDSEVKNDVGIAATISVPLDGSAVELCKQAARVQIRRQEAEADKASLDYNLVRALKCTEFIQAGAFFHPSSAYGQLCSDIVARYSDGSYRNGIGQVIVAAPQPQQPQPRTCPSCEVVWKEPS